MAKMGITDLGEGFGEFLAHADKYHNLRDKTQINPFNHYIADKVAQKGRRYNTLRNRPKDGSEEREKAAKAKAYRKERDGE